MRGGIFKLSYLGNTELPLASGLACCKDSVPLWLLVYLHLTALLDSSGILAPLCQLSHLTRNNQIFLFLGIKISKENSLWVMCPSLTSLYGLGWGTLIGLTWLKPSTLVSREGWSWPKDPCGWQRSSWKTKRSNTFLTLFLISALELVSITFNPDS